MAVTVEGVGVGGEAAARGAVERGRARAAAVARAVVTMVVAAWAEVDGLGVEARVAAGLAMAAAVTEEGTEEVAMEVDLREAAVGATATAVADGVKAADGVRVAWAAA